MPTASKWDVFLSVVITLVTPESKLAVFLNLDLIFRAFWVSLNTKMFGNITKKKKSELLCAFVLNLSAQSSFSP